MTYRSFDIGTTENEVCTSTNWPGLMDTGLMGTYELSLRTINTHAIGRIKYLPLGLRFHSFKVKHNIVIGVLTVGI